MLYTSFIAAGREVRRKAQDLLDLDARLTGHRGRAAGNTSGMGHADARLRAGGADGRRVGRAVDSATYLGGTQYSASGPSNAGVPSQPDHIMKPRTISDRILVQSMVCLLRVGGEKGDAAGAYSRRGVACQRQFPLVPAPRAGYNAPCPDRIAPPAWRPRRGHRPSRLLAAVAARPPRRGPAGRGRCRRRPSWPSSCSTAASMPPTPPGRFLDAPLSRPAHAGDLLPGVPEAVDRIFRSPRRPAARSASTATTTSTASPAPPSCCRCSRCSARGPDLYVPSRLEEGYGLNVEALRQIAGGRRRPGHHRRLRHRQPRRGRRGAPPGPRTDHHRPPRDEGRAARRRRAGPPAPAGHGTTRSARCAARASPSNSPGRWPCPQVRRREGHARLPRDAARRHRPGRPGRHRRRGAAARREPHPRPLRPGPPGREAVRRPRGAVRVGRASSSAAGVKAGDVGFRLAPRLNAVGRLGQAVVAVELLTTTPPRARRGPRPAPRDAQRDAPDDGARHASSAPAR